MCSGQHIFSSDKTKLLVKKNFNLNFKKTLIDKITSELLRLNNKIKYLSHILAFPQANDLSLFVT